MQHSAVASWSCLLFQNRPRIGQGPDGFVQGIRRLPIRESLLKMKWTA